MCTTHQSCMAWGKGPASQGLEDLCARLRRNDAQLTSLTLFKHRRVDHSGLNDLCDALVVNTTLTELNCTSHAIDPSAAGMVGAMLRRNKTLTALSLGDGSFGDHGVAALVEGMSNPCTVSLQSLDVENKVRSAAPWLYSTERHLADFRTSPTEGRHRSRPSSQPARASSDSTSPATPSVTKVLSMVSTATPCHSLPLHCHSIATSLPLTATHCHSIASMTKVSHHSLPLTPHHHSAGSFSQALLLLQVHRGRSCCT